MANKTSIPRLGYILRAVIKAAGYRGYFEKIGLDKDLDDCALESRPGVTTELIEELEEACESVLIADCGIEWAQFFKQEWEIFRKEMQFFVCNVDICRINSSEAEKAVFVDIIRPILTRLISRCFRNRDVPEIDVWCRKPFMAWVRFAASKVSISEDDLLDRIANHLNADQRSLERWKAGEPIGKLAGPYDQVVGQILRQQHDTRCNETEAKYLTGWLMLSVAIQSLSKESRDTITTDTHLRTKESWSIVDGVRAINGKAFEQRHSDIQREVDTITKKIQDAFALMPRDTKEVQLQLALFSDLIQRNPCTYQSAYQHIYDWFSARLAVLQGKQREALQLYENAVAGVWWSDGPNHHPILEEALLYAVGVGDKVAAENYWDKTFLIGLNKGTKRLLDEQELRRISFGFEKMFYPLKSKQRIPPKFELIERTEKFSVSAKHLAKPNQKTKHAEGRTRRTPLMDAILQGTLDDVKRLIEAGGDPNDYIHESGEGPLVYAMRRAQSQHDPEIMDHLLSFDLDSDTVNRPASTFRETPLKLAIEMACIKTVRRLIKLGAQVEKPCDYLPSALCFATIRFYQNLHKDFSKPLSLYLQGKTLPDVYDAKDGAILDIDLLSRRASKLSIFDCTKGSQQIFNELIEVYARPVEDCRQVIQLLLEAGADANRRYQVESEDISEWTPTLFAAQIGDIDLFKMLVEYDGPNRGNPELTLMPPTRFEQFDALWVAIDHKRHDIVSYLTKRRKYSSF